MTSNLFKEADVRRAIKSAEAAGVKVETVEIVLPNGTTIRVSGACKTPNPWDDIHKGDAGDR